MDLGVASVGVGLVGREVGELRRGLVHRRGVEAVLERRGDALAVRVEGDVGARAVRDVLRERGVDGLEPDDGAGRGLRDVELHGARDDAVHLAAEDPRVVAEEAVQSVEHGGVAAELHVLRRHVEAVLADDAAVAIDGEEGVFLVVGGELVGDGVERALRGVLRAARHGVLAACARRARLAPPCRRSRRGARRGGGANRSGAASR